METDLKTTRLTLIERLGSGTDDDAWGEFQRFYWDLITGWARGFGCPPSMVDDVFQETMVCLLRNLPTFEYQPEKGRFRSYLKTIVSRRVADAFRRESSYVSESSLAGAGEDGGESPLDRLAETPVETEAAEDVVWTRSLIAQALRETYAKIDTITYKSFCLYVLDGLPIAEVLKRLDIEREGTVYQQKSRFLKLMKAEFEALLTRLDSVEGGRNVVSERMFKEAVNELIASRPEYRETILNDQTPRKIFNRLAMIREMLAKAPTPPDEPEWLLLASESQGRGDVEWLIPCHDMTFGRNDDNAVVVEADDASGLHARLMKTSDETWTLKDENSANGTYVNGAKITEQVLSDGDVIQIATRVYAFLSNGGSESLKA